MYRTALKTLLPFLILTGCQQAVPPEEPDNLRPELNLVAEPDSGFAPLEVALRANARDPEGKSLTYNWSIGAESPEGDATLIYTFEEPGEYTVDLTVSDGKFDSETDSVLIIVYGEGDPEL